MATTQAKKALRAARKREGLCIHCGAEAKPEQTRCQRCATRDAENRKRYAARDAQRGVCSNTGCSRKVTGKKRYCDSCSSRNAAQTARRRKRRAAAGFCSQCGKHPRWDQRIRCKACTEKLNANVARLVERRIAAGQCGHCGNNALKPGYRTCQQCIDNRRAWHRQLKQAVLDAYGGAQCVGCGEDEFWVLQIDHTNGGGHKHALEIGNGDATRGRSKMYRWLRDNEYPEGYRVLCANCNIRAARGIPLPHTTPNQER